MEDKTSLTIRFYAGAAAAAGIAEHRVSLGDKTNLRQLADYLVGEFPALEPILPLCTFLSVQESRVLNPDTTSGEAIGSETVAAGDTIEVLPPFAGG